MSESVLCTLQTDSLQTGRRSDQDMEGGWEDVVTERRVEREGSEQTRSAQTRTWKEAGRTLLQSGVHSVRAVILTAIGYKVRSFLNERELASGYLMPTGGTI